MSAGVATSYAQRGASTTLLGATLLLLVLGSIMVYSTTAPLTLGDFIPPHLARHSLGLILGVAAAWMLSHIPHRVLRYAAPALFVATLAALAVVPFVGIRVNGAQRWLSLPGVGVFQPGELAKFAHSPLGRGPRFVPRRLRIDQTFARGRHAPNYAPKRDPMSRRGRPAGGPSSSSSPISATPRCS